MVISQESSQESDMQNVQSSDASLASAPQCWRKRGRSRALSTMKLYAGVKMKLKLNTHGQPIGKEAQKLSSYIGTLARNPEQTPLNYFTWKGLPESYKEDVWKLVKEKYELHDSTVNIDMIKPWVFKVYARLWRTWRCRLHKIYSKYDTHAERMQHRDETIPEAQWELLMRHFDSAESKARSRKNTAIRGLYKFPHTVGPKSFARFRAELAEGSESCLSRAQFWIESHISRHENSGNKATHEMIGKLKEALTNLPEGLPDVPSSRDVLSQVVGADKPGCVRTYGMGVKSSDIFEAPPSKIELIQQNAAMRKELVNVKQRMSSMEAKLAKLSDLECQIARMTNIHAKLSKVLRSLSNDKA